MFPGHSLSDEIYMRKADIYMKIDNLEMALDMYERIILEFSYDILIDDALYNKAKIYDEILQKEEEAMVLHFQNQVLREQDEELTDLSNHVTRTKHIALAVGEELDLHTRLLDDFDDDVEHTSGNLKRIASSARRLFERIGKSNFSLRCCLAVLIFMLVVLVALSILKVEGKFHPKFT